MISFTMSLAGIYAHYTFPETLIHSMSKSAEMGRVDTSPILAFMVYLFSFRYGALEQLVGNPMSLLRISAIPDLSIACRISASLEIPATSQRINFNFR